MIWPFLAPARELFAFYDGRRTRRVDPLAVWRAVSEHPTFRFDKLDEVSASGALIAGESGKAEEWFHESVKETAAAARELFGLKMYDEGGLAEHECVRLLFAFRDYIDGVKKNTSTPPTPPASTDAISNTSGEPTTSDTSLTSCLDDGSLSAGPGPPTREAAERSESPSEATPAPT